MKTKSQLERWQAKHGKHATDQHVLQAKAAKEANKTQEEMNEKMQKKVIDTVSKATGVEFEPKMVAFNDEGLKTFATTMMNSFESMLNRRDQQRVPQQQGVTIEQVEELINHKMGIMMSTMTQMMDKMYQPVVHVEHDTALDNVHIEFDMTTLKANVVEKEFVGEITLPKPEPKKAVNKRSKRVNWNKMTPEEAKRELFNLMLEAEFNHGIDITSTRQFKNLKGKFNTAYQLALPIIFGGAGKRGKVSGRWVELVKEYEATTSTAK